MTEILNKEIDADLEETTGPVAIGSIALKRREARLLKSRRLRKEPNPLRHGDRVHSGLYRLLLDYYTDVHKDLKEKRGPYYSNASSSVYAGNTALQGSNFTVAENARLVYTVAFTPGKTVGTIMRYENPNPQGTDSEPWMPNIDLGTEGATIILRTQIL
jgi:hypothetical protein